MKFIKLKSVRCLLCNQLHLTGLEKGLCGRCRDNLAVREQFDALQVKLIEMFQRGHLSQEQYSSVEGQVGKAQTTFKTCCRVKL